MVCTGSCLSSWVGRDCVSESWKQLFMWDHSLFDKHFWLLFQISCSLGECFLLIVIIPIVWNCWISWLLFFQLLSRIKFPLALLAGAHIGVGISGQEGMEAVLARDCSLQMPSEALADSWQAFFFQNVQVLVLFLLQKLCFDTAAFVVYLLWLLCSGLFLFSKFINEQNADLYTSDT